MAIAAVVQRAAGCVVCDEGLPKYRCPVCRIARYCSVRCYKVHEGMCAGAKGRDGARKRDAEGDAGVAATAGGQAPERPPKRPAIENGRGAAAGEDPPSKIGRRATDDASCRLTDAQLRRVLDSDVVRTGLQDASLREAIRRIDASDCREEALMRAMTVDASFEAFVHGALDVLDGESKTK